MRQRCVNLAVCLLFLIAAQSFLACSEKEEAAETSATAAQTTPATTASPASEPTAERQWAFRGQRGITAGFVATDLALYRSLLPSAFDMPETPIVAVVVVNYYDVTLPLTHYSEGYVVMQCSFQGRTGWYVLTMPVDDEVANAGGRALGFPKYVADKIELGEPGGKWTGVVSHQGREVMRIEFTPTPGAKPHESTTSDGGLPVFLLLPPAEGPQVNEVHINIFGNQRKLSTPGTAEVEADAGEPWAGLLPTGGVVPSATLDELSGEWVLSGTP